MVTLRDQTEGQPQALPSSPLYFMASRVTAWNGMAPPVAVTQDSRVPLCKSEEAAPRVWMWPRGCWTHLWAPAAGMGTRSEDKAELPPSPLMLLLQSRVQAPVPGHWVLWAASFGQGPDYECLYFFVPPLP